MQNDEKVTLEYALEEVNLGEIRMAERFFGKVFGDDGDRAMTPMESLAMGIWVRERRLRPNGGFTLADTEKMTMKQSGEYFVDDNEIDAEDPDTDLGKDSSPAGELPENEPSSAPS